TYDKPALPAPGPGKSLVRHFADDGSFISAEVSSNPTPGVLDTIEVSSKATDAHQPAVQATASSSSLAYIALGGLGVVALAAAGAQRYRTARAAKTSSTDEPSS